MWAYSLVVVLAIGGRWLYQLEQHLARPEGFLPPNDQSCQLRGVSQGMVGSEDMALGRHSILLITSGDLKTVFEEGSLAATPGGLWALDMRPGGGEHPVPLELAGLPEGRRFQGHGLDVSNRTDRVYAVSHNGDHSSVEIFAIHYRPSCLSLPWSCTPVLLTLLHTITSPLFPNSGINDVVEAADGEVYVSQWQPFPLPVHGQHHPGTLLERIQVHLTLPILLLGFPRLTTVLHCRWGEGGHSCTPATEESFVGANGMTMNADGSTVFVNDPVEKLITVMAREEGTGRLTKTGTIPLPVAVDNIEHDDTTGIITVGKSLPLISCPPLLSSSFTPLNPLQAT